MTSISGAGGFRPPPPGKPPGFEKLDGNGDGALSLDEFKAGAPKNVDSARSEALFKKIDADGDGSVTKAESEEFHAKLEKADNQLQSFLIGLQSAPAGTKEAEEEEDGEDLFVSLDADSDGSLAREEFLKAISPDDSASSELLNKLFDAIDTDKDGQVSKEETEAFQTAVQRRGPPPPPPLPAFGASEAYGSTSQLGARASAGSTYSQAA